jgi:hypothetical protein
MKPLLAFVLRARHRVMAAAVAGLVFVAVLDPGQPAHAYLDPGTGGFILQMLLGGFAGALVVGKLYWHRFIEIFGRAGKDDAAAAESPPASDPPAE